MEFLLQNGNKLFSWSTVISLNRESTLIMKDTFKRNSQNDVNGVRYWANWDINFLAVTFQSGSSLVTTSLVHWSRTYVYKQIWLVTLEWPDLLQIWAHNKYEMFILRGAAKLNCDVEKSQCTKKIYLCTDLGCSTEKYVNSCTRTNTDNFS